MNLLDLAAELADALADLGAENDRYDQLQQMYREQLARVEQELAALDPYGPDGSVTLKYRRLAQDRARLMSKLWEDA